jgi:hypothetical protein
VVVVVVTMIRTLIRGGGGASGTAAANWRDAARALPDDRRFALLCRETRRDIMDELVQKPRIPLDPHDVGATADKVAAAVQSAAGDGGHAVCDGAVCDGETSYECFFLHHVEVWTRTLRRICVIF